MKTRNSRPTGLDTTATASDSPMARRIGNVAQRLSARLRNESNDALWLAGTTVFLVIVGLVMVLSSTTVTDYVNTGGFFGTAFRQLMFALLGIPVMLFLARLSPITLKRLAPITVLLSSALQALVVFTPLGIEVAGNTNWISLGGIQFQPSEAIKVSLVLWLGHIYAEKHDKIDNLKEGVLPIALTTAAPIGLVLLGGDLGTSVVMIAMLVGTLFLLGVKLRHLVVMMVATLIIALMFVMTSQNRMNRVMTFITGSDTVDYLNEGWQIQHALYAIANGGVFGVGLGNSTAKWSWLPAADNDFIFAIIAEELGMVGATIVIALYVTLCIFLVRVYLKALTPWARAVGASVFVWLAVQATGNILVVLGLLPAFGVPLPLVSSGGTALVTTLAAIGVAIAAARSNEDPQRVGR